MVTRPVRAAAFAALAVAAGLIALPACDKKKAKSTDSTPPPPANTDNPRGDNPRGGPPGGTQPQGEPGMPTPPPAGPHLTHGIFSAGRDSTQNLKQIGLAFHNYHDTNNGLPTNYTDANGKPTLSWRVALLPFLDQDNLFKQFKTTEPWDSEHNKRFLSQMPKIYAPPGVWTESHTYYRSFTGAGSVMEPRKQAGAPGAMPRGLSFVNITDGTANTIVVAEAFEPVIWTKPDDLPNAPGKPPKLGGGIYGDGFHALFADGAVRRIQSNKVDAKTLSNLIQTNDGNIVNID
jgi:uncharacterized protein DUF1559